MRLIKDKQKVHVNVDLYYMHTLHMNATCRRGHFSATLGLFAEDVEAVATTTTASVLAFHRSRQNKKGEFALKHLTEATHCFPVQALVIKKGRFTELQVKMTQIVE